MNSTTMSGRGQRLQSLWVPRPTVRADAVLTANETIALIRQSAWSRIVFTALLGVLAAGFLSWTFVLAWTICIVAWEAAVRPYLEDRFVRDAFSHPFVRLAAINAVGSIAYVIVPTLLWATEAPLAMVLATAWMSGTANHVFVYFSGRRILLLACLIPLGGTALLAPLLAQGMFTPAATIGAITLILLIAAAGLWGYDRRALLLQFSDRTSRNADDGRARARFFGTMSHELRTPLNAVIGYAELIEEESGAAAQDARHIRLAAQRLLGLVNTVLEISRLESEPIRIAAEPCDVPTLLAEIRTRAVPLANANRNAFFAINTPDAAELRTNPDRLQQCLILLVSNACKFTADGEVRLNVSREDADIVFVVSDTGIGIPEAHWESIFEPFAQVDASDTRRHEGAGLGLALARQIARGLGGDIACRSQLGEGAAFTLRLPAAGSLAPDGRSA